MKLRYFTIAFLLNTLILSCFYNLTLGINSLQNEIFTFSFFSAFPGVAALPLAGASFGCSLTFSTALSAWGFLAGLALLNGRDLAAGFELARVAGFAAGFVFLGCADAGRLAAAVFAFDFAFDLTIVVPGVRRNAVKSVISSDADSKFDQIPVKPSYIQLLNSYGALRRRAGQATESGSGTGPE